MRDAIVFSNFLRSCRELWRNDDQVVVEGILNSGSPSQG